MHHRIEGGHGSRCQGGSPGLVGALRGIRTLGLRDLGQRGQLRCGRLFVMLRRIFLGRAQPLELLFGLDGLGAGYGYAVNVPKLLSSKRPNMIGKAKLSQSARARPSKTYSQARSFSRLH